MKGKRYTTAEQKIRILREAEQHEERSGPEHAKGATEHLALQACRGFRQALNVGIDLGEDRSGLVDCVNYECCPGHD